MILRTENIVKSYKNTKKIQLNVLRAINIEIEENKISVIVGASGAGKSTLLHIIGGLDRPDSGEVYFRDQNIFKLSDDKLARFRNKNIGFVFQFHHLLPEFTAVENVAIPQMITGKSLEQASKKARELLEAVGMANRLSHKPAELSGGEQQRVAVARSLANEPDIILADEPTGNLDSENSNALHKILIDLRDNMEKTFIIVTHNPALVNLADRVYEIKDGKIITRNEQADSSGFS
ncbi:MAG TPA: ABC transporter ATP-binding protein [Ignavibacteriaceae bacterium]|nr:ABC transporter ATP-binding protein [Ignavibacteriaceae bacterium]